VVNNIDKKRSTAHGRFEDMLAGFDILETPHPSSAITFPPDLERPSTYLASEEVPYSLAKY
jgi:hypothetical protein